MPSDAYQMALKETLKIFNSQTQNAWVVNYHGSNTTYQDAYAYAKACGDASSNALMQIVPSAVESGQISLNEAQGIISEVMSASSDSVARMSQYAQQTMLDGLGVDLKPIGANKEDIYARIKNLAIKYGEADADESARLLSKPIQEVFNKKTVTDTQKANADFLDSAGFKVRIHRIPAPNCCDFCTNLGGIYTEQNAPKDLWLFHTNCGCYIDYEAGKTKSRVSMSTNARGERTKVTTERR